MEQEHWNNIKSYLLKIGLSVDYQFLSKIKDRDDVYIKSKISDLSLLIHKKVDTTYFINNLNSDDEIKAEYQIINYINRGKYNKIYSIKEKNSVDENIYRIGTSITRFKNNDKYIQAFIHGFLTAYQNLFLKKHRFINLLDIGFDTNYKMIITICEKMDGTLSILLSTKEIEMNMKKKYLINALLQISHILKKIQKKFKFVHNDLKADNIFYKNSDFYIGDFDTCFLQINDNLIIGDELFLSDKQFNSKKDLFILLHSLYFALNTNEWDVFFFNKFPINRNVKNNQELFYSLYKYKEDDINNVFNPVIMEKYIKRHFEEYITVTC
jgi:hypothetical protein